MGESRIPADSEGLAFAPIVFAQVRCIGGLDRLSAAVGMAQA